ncbi:MAG TPA: YdcF family protein [Candidatus Saccharimonadia bacterium]
MKRFLVGLLIFIGLVAAIAAGFFFGIGYYLSPQDQLAKSDAIVAISGGDTNARTTEAVNLYKDGWAKHLIFSGAALDPNSPSNAAAMAHAAEAAGVPASAIVLDEAAQNTRGNAAGVADIVKQQQYRSIILVTSPYHQRRASLVFHRALGNGVRILNHSSYDQTWRRSHWWATPISQSITYVELQKVAYELLSGN